MMRMKPPTMFDGSDDDKKNYNDNKEENKTYIPKIVIYANQLTTKAAELPAVFVDPPHIGLVLADIVRVRCTVGFLVHARSGCSHTYSRSATCCHDDSTTQV